MESTEIAIFSTLLGLILALTDAYIERNIPGWYFQFIFKLNKI